MYILRHNRLLIAFDCIGGSDLAYRQQWRMDCNDTRLASQIDESQNGPIAVFGSLRLQRRFVDLRFGAAFRSYHFQRWNGVKWITR